MNLVLTLRGRGIEWAIDNIILTKEQAEAQGRHQRDLLRVRLCDWNSVPAGQTPAKLEKCYLNQSDVKVDRLLALAVRDLLPDHPIRREYLNSKGNTPVTIDPDSLGEGLGPCVHTALRKLMDSQESIIQWNAIHHLLPEDWSHALRLIREEVQAVLDKAKTKNRPPLQREVGVAIQTAMTERFNEIFYRDDGRAERARTDIQRFALKSFGAANKLTAVEDFVFGWGGYLCQDAEKQIEKSSDQSPSNSPSS